ncbi:MAG TPA: 2-oxo-4-hydroxy-4-carboxy-5-ureidoimidazoline decarboxylase [Pelagibacteraceae bacterium]|jgi:2-oxo-4-hydroxy-4-carboxy-5-ureidoimidazoline decarboxylase|nr:2-oxo-4-hydroxy-4-carboxy-5-ureidoimidazoline decarboxylase [Pelagibacteraceae bacterium]|tara:strand:+ start:1802 stop:2308 length:507 start_codon:yes stop_codon:yes gene_type:complete
MNAIDEFNKLSRSKFIGIFANIFEKTKWIAEKLYNQKPFDSFEDLCSKMLRIFETTTKENQLRILKAHPDLADKATVNSLSTNSRAEQSNAGLDLCSKEEFNEFKNLNDEYKKKFGFPFILAVGGRNKTEILNKFKKRILNTADDEFREAISQVCKIANLRLNEINIK